MAYEQLLQAAVKYEGLNEILNLLKKGANPNLILDDPEWNIHASPLVLAVIKRDRYIVNILLANDADPNQVASCYIEEPLKVRKTVMFVSVRRPYTTPLHEAARRDKLDIVKALFACDANMHQSIKGETAFHWAVQYGRVNIVNYFLSLDVDVNKSRDAGFTPLLLALSGSQSIIHQDDVKASCAQEDYDKIVLALLQRGADPNVQVPVVHGNHSEITTPLIEAARRGVLQSIRYLLEFSADVNKVVNGKSVAARMLEVIPEKNKNELRVLIKQHRFSSGNSSCGESGLHFSFLSSRKGSASNSKKEEQKGKEPAREENLSLQCKM